jgi:hypothetical protein
VQLREDVGPVTRLCGAILAALLLTGCSEGSDEVGEGADTGAGTIKEYPVNLNDGRTVTCLVYAQGYKGGMDCEWEQRSR